MQHVANHCLRDDIKISGKISYLYNAKGMESKVRELGELWQLQQLDQTQPSLPVREVQEQCWSYRSCRSYASYGSCGRSCPTCSLSLPSMLYHASFQLGQKIANRSITTAYRSFPKIYIRTNLQIGPSQLHIGPSRPKTCNFFIFAPPLYNQGTLLQYCTFQELIFKLTFTLNMVENYYQKKSVVAYPVAQKRPIKEI